MELGDYPTAIRDLDQAIMLDPYHPYAESGRELASHLVKGNGAV